MAEQNTNHNFLSKVRKAFFGVLNPFTALHTLAKVEDSIPKLPGPTDVLSTLSGMAPETPSALEILTNDFNDEFKGSPALWNNAVIAVREYIGINTALPNNSQKNNKGQKNQNVL